MPGSTWTQLDGWARRHPVRASLLALLFAWIGGYMIAIFVWDPLDPPAAPYRLDVEHVTAMQLGRRVNPAATRPGDAGHFGGYPILKTIAELGNWRLRGVYNSLFGPGAASP